jgi:hypothetical protein
VSIEAAVGHAANAGFSFLVASVVACFVDESNGVIAYILSLKRKQDPQHFLNVSSTEDQVLPTSIAFSFSIFLR